MSAVDKEELEAFISKYLDESDLEYAVDFWSDIKEQGVIDSEKSAIIGHFYGDTLAYFLTSRIQRKRLVTEEDIELFNETFFRKVLEIIPELNRLIN